MINSSALIQATTLPLSRTREGLAFDPNEDFWRFRAGADAVQMNFEWIRKHAEAEFVDSYKKTLVWYAENKSLKHAANMFSRSKHLYKHMGNDAKFIIREITEVDLLNYHAAFGEKTWYLGSLAGFLKKWHALGYRGVTRGAVALLNQLKLTGNKKGVAVATMDLHNGPFSDIELESIQSALNKSYARGEIEKGKYLLAWLFMVFGFRPRQYALLKIADFDVLRDANGGLSYSLKVPRAKQRGLPRAEFKNRLITPQLGSILHEYVVELKDALKDKLENVSNLPLFPAPANENQPEGMEYHLTAREVSAELTETLSELKVYSERTGSPIHITATRFRRTIGTRAAREGHGELIIAELLDHSDTQHVGVYVQSTPEIVERIDRAVALTLAPLAQAFAGAIVSDESQADRGSDPSSRILDPRIDRSCQPMGNCGSHGFCGFSAPIACYTCHSFQAWLDGPHEAVLEHLLAARERKLQTTDLRIASINDRTILAVAQVVQQCKAIKDSEKEIVDEC